ncbi:matrixin family metalloprotease [Opitutus terrae]|uniref:Peptidase M10A and M12B matrixin and adamalysin n=1 Tax=Opitutus terrae (strain DSM 11246 / JCM 15787 / PB90-1) TaxID=452637 RepID=B1ZZS6_OPITP|nr:matrixin family metalloprotease [Opitutus terrae]ACB77262.1 peptidase M10A and M12B matrixin and adamalysin [Opitutus terrae PB90-1]
MNRPFSFRTPLNVTYWVTFGGGCLRRAILALAIASTVQAYMISGTSWPSGDIPLQLQLGAPAAPLLDGSTHWDDVAISALNRWNEILGRARFSGVKNSNAGRDYPNVFNNVFFSSTVYGDDWGDRVLAITLRRSRGSNTAEADVLVNSKESWNSYRGSLRSSVRDLERVLAHEFGHVLGLGHPDEAKPAQSVAAVMNSHVSNVYTLQPDDVAGANALYASGIGAPVATGSLTDQTITAGSPLTLTFAASGTNVTYDWTFAPSTNATQRELLDGDGERWSAASFSLFSAQPSDSGTYSVLARNAAGASTVSTARVTVTPVSMANAMLANLSARGRAGTGSETFIVGFVVTGKTPKPVLVRAIGPTLSGQGIQHPLADPRLTLFRTVDGASSTVDANDNWSADAATAANLRAAAQRLGAFALPDGSTDAALLVTLEPGVYSAHVDSQGGAAGITLVEVYDADQQLSDSLTHKLVNVSTRSFAGAGEEQLIAGFVVGGTSPKQVLLRAVGPGLKSRGVTDVNTDPNLTLFRGTNAIADNDDWAYSNQTDLLPAVFTRVGTSQLDPDSYDSALLITLPPGVYTASAAGRSGETGVVLLEVFEVAE